jgi:WD40 repeat protein
MLIGKRPAALVVMAMCIGLCTFAVPATSNSEDNKREKPKETSDAEVIDKLIVQLDANSFQDREDAIRRLIAVGAPALAPLQRLADDPRTDPDVRLRAARAAFAIATVKIDPDRRLGVHSNSWAQRVALSPDGKQAVTSGFDGLRCWDLSGGKQVRVFGKNQRGYWSLAFSADGRQLIAGGADHHAYVFDAKTGQRVQQLMGHTNEVWGAVLTADGKQALTGAWDRSIRVWDMATGKQSRVFNNVRDNVRCMILSPDGKLLAAGHFAVVNGPGTIRLWDVAKGTEIRAMSGHEMEVSSVAFSPDGKLLVSTSFDKTVRIWRVADGKEIKRLNGHDGRIEGAAFTSDGQRVVSCCCEGDPTVRLWDVASGKLLGASDKTDEGFLSLAVLPGNRHCLTTGKDGAVRTWRWTR